MDADFIRKRLTQLRIVWSLTTAFISPLCPGNDLFLADGFHSVEDLMRNLSYHAVQDVHRIACLPIAVNAVAGFAILRLVDVAFDYLNEFLFAGKSFAVIAFTFQDAPKSFHWAIINAMAHTGHTLRHTGLLELVVKSSAGILVTSVAVKQRMCVWIGPSSFTKVL